MISGLCESPLTFPAIIIWRDELNEGKILLRDIIDLEAPIPDRSPRAPAGDMPVNGANGVHAVPPPPPPLPQCPRARRRCRGRRRGPHAVSEDDLDD